MRIHLQITRLILFSPPNFMFSYSNYFGMNTIEENSKRIEGYLSQLDKNIQNTVAVLENWREFIQKGEMSVEEKTQGNPNSAYLMCRTTSRLLSRNEVLVY